MNSIASSTEKSNCEGTKNLIDFLEEHTKLEVERFSDSETSIVLPEEEGLFIVDDRIHRAEYRNGRYAPTHQLETELFSLLEKLFSKTLWLDNPPNNIDTVEEIFRRGSEIIRNRKQVIEMAEDLDEILEEENLKE